MPGKRSKKKPFKKLEGASVDIHNKINKIKTLLLKAIEEMEELGLFNAAQAGAEEERIEKLLATIERDPRNVLAALEKKLEDTLRVIVEKSEQERTIVVRKGTVKTEIELKAEKALELIGQLENLGIINEKQLEVINRRIRILIKQGKGANEEILRELNIFIKNTTKRLENHEKSLLRRRPSGPILREKSLNKKLSNLKAKLKLLENKSGLRYKGIPELFNLVLKEFEEKLAFQRSAIKNAIKEMEIYLQLLKDWNERSSNSFAPSQQYRMELIKLYKKRFESEILLEKLDKLNESLKKFR
jgi:hypothetical protein